MSTGSIYATLDRLEDKGYVRSRTGEPTTARGGRAKRHFQVTAKGAATVNRTHAALGAMAAGLKLARSVS